MSSPDKKIGRNPPWSRDELIIALDVYIKHRDRLPSQHDGEILEVSHFLKQLSGSLGSQNASFRNPNGVHMKLANFRSIDPVYLAQGKKGLTRGSHGDHEVWDDFAGNPHALSLAASAIRETVKFGSPILIDNDTYGITEAPEGRLLTRVHVSRERNKKLVDEKKKAAIRKYGKLACEACEFDFAKSYGERGSGFLEAHHLTPVSLLKPGSKTRLDDLCLLCANCHRMVHAKRPWLSVPELKASLK